MREILSRCVFCRMSTGLRWLGLPLCPICRDQLYDFVWVSVVQVLVWSMGGLSGWTFVIEEIFLFFVLVLVKHRLPPPWERS